MFRYEYLYTIFKLLRSIYFLLTLQIFASFDTNGNTFLDSHT